MKISKVFLLILIVNFILRLFLSQFMAPYLSNDEAGNFILAKSIFEGRGLTADSIGNFFTERTQVKMTNIGREFIHPFILSLFFRLFGVSIFSAKLMSTFFSHCF